MHLCRPEALRRKGRRIGRAKVKARKKQMAFLQNVFPIEICKQLTYFTTTTTAKSRSRVQARPRRPAAAQQHFFLLHIIIIIVDFCYLSVHGYESLSLCMSVCLCFRGSTILETCSRALLLLLLPHPP